jgi:hypothetical protein
MDSYKHGERRFLGPAETRFTSSCQVVGLKDTEPGILRYGYATSFVCLLSSPELVTETGISAYSARSVRHVQMYDAT